jgi:hypothetical protein
LAIDPGTGGVVAGELDKTGEQLPPEDDHDLLTHTQASDRLAEAIADEQDALRAAEAAGDAERVAHSRDRLRLLQQGAGRHGTPRIDATNAAAFYGWDTAAGPAAGGVPDAG